MTRGGWPVEVWQRHGITYLPSERTKSELYLEALPAMNAGRIELLDLSMLRLQLLGLERRTARGGRNSVDHRPGSRDDVANAACGALVTVLTAPPAEYHGRSTPGPRPIIRLDDDVRRMMPNGRIDTRLQSARRLMTEPLA